MYACIKHFGMTYQDVLSAPTCERRFFLLKLMNENQKRIEAREEVINNNAGAKGTRSTRVGGEQLKAKLKNGEIPNY